MLCGIVARCFVFDQEEREKTYSFSSMVAVCNYTGIGKIMAERGSSDAIENYGVGGLGAQISEPFKSLIKKVW